MFPKSKFNCLFLQATLLFLSVICVVPVVHAGIGFADSTPSLLDTQPPSLELDPIPENLFVHTGDNIVFHWTCSEGNPSSSESDYQATVLIDDSPDSNLSWYPDIEEFFWDWTAPEVQSPFCHLEVSVRDIFGNQTTVTSTDFTVLFSTTDSPDLPDRVQCGVPFPNPFNPSCQLEFALPAAGRTTLSIHDVRGHRVRLLESGVRPMGVHSVRWDGTDDRGQPQPGGLYFFVLKVQTEQGEQKYTRRAVLVP
jgi:hypothetical protein